MITEMVDWMTRQAVWAEPIMYFLVCIACIKYIILGGEEK